MKICGLNKTTLLDYPGMVAATIFLGGCNFRCPFCHNGALVLHPETEPALDPEKILDFLKKRQGILDGVCITGGEPSLSPNLMDFLRKIKELNYRVKLDTNGSKPDVIKTLWSERLIDKVAMDIKACPERYSVLTGIAKPDLSSIFETVDFLMQGKLDYEFRTTVVKELHSREDFVEIGKWLEGAKAYYLQAYKESADVLQPGFSSYSLDEMKNFQNILLERIPLVEIRGMD